MGKTILIVDDFETTLFTVGFTLEGKGYKVLKASSAEDAQKLLDGREINLVVTDFNMPGMNGAEFTQFIRQSQEYKSVPVLVLSTDTMPEKKKDALKMGATGWVQKPYQLEDFVRIVNRAIK